MSGPLTRQDTAAATAPEQTTGPTLEITRAHVAEVGGQQVQRALPRRGRRTVGAWCFLDHAGPAPPGGPTISIGPHPHMGLQTVTWLLAGEILHTDSLGSEQAIRPGQLNLMTAGHGVAHAEETLDGRGLHAVQLWVAQPESTRHGPAAFEHHATLPRTEVGGAEITVISGELAGLRSPARTDTPLVGAQLTLHDGDITLPLRADFEHALVVLDGAVRIGGEDVPPDTLAYLGGGRESITLRPTAPARALLLGGEPFESPLLMWWNFVGRSRDEMDAAYGDWQAESERFGTVRSRLARIPAPLPFWSNTAQT